MVLPEHQGKGYASAALGRLIERAREAGVDVDYGGRNLRCNHWALWADPASGSASAR